MPKQDLDGVLSDLKRQRDDINRRIAETEERHREATSIEGRMQKWRERSEQPQIGPDDPTVRLRR